MGTQVARHVPRTPQYHFFCSLDEHTIGRLYRGIGRSLFPFIFFENFVAEIKLFVCISKLAYLMRSRCTHRNAALERLSFGSWLQRPSPEQRRIKTCRCDIRIDSINSRKQNPLHGTGRNAPARTNRVVAHHREFRNANRRACL